MKEFFKELADLLEKHKVSIGMYYDQDNYGSTDGDEIGFEGGDRRLNIAEWFYDFDVGRGEAVTAHLIRERILKDVQ